MTDDFNERLEEQLYEPTQEWIFTFGSNHIWPLTGTSMLKYYIVLKGTFEGTRREVGHRFANRWSNQYPSREAAGVDKYGLAEQRLEHFKEEYR